MGTLEPIQGPAHLAALQTFWSEDCWDKHRVYDSCTACPYYMGGGCSHPKRPRALPRPVKRHHRVFVDAGVAGRFCRKLQRTQGYRRERQYDEMDPYAGRRGIISYVWVKDLSDGMIEMHKIGSVVYFKRFYNR